MLNTWFYVFKRSLTDPTYYKELEKTKFSFSLKYLYLLLVFVFLITGVQFAIQAFRLLPNVSTQANKMKQALREDYPTGLELKIDKTGLTTNVEQPFYINFPKTRDFLKIKDKTNFITINTEASVEDYQTSKTLILLTKNSAIYPDDKSSELGAYKVIPFNEVEQPLIVNEAIYSQMFVKSEPFVKALPTIVTVFGVMSLTLFPFIAAGFALSGKLFYLLIMTLIIMLLSKIMKKNFKYSTLYRLGIHGLTQSILVTTLLGFFGLYYPWLYTGLFVVWMSVVLNKVK